MSVIGATRESSDSPHPFPCENERFVYTWFWLSQTQASRAAHGRNVRITLFGYTVGFLDNWYSWQLAVAYFAWTAVALMGVLQVAAARFRRQDLAWFRSPRRCYAVGLLLWIGGLGAFYATQYRLLFAPGPAAGEAALLFGIAALVAVLVTRAVVYARHARKHAG